jgi:hypothetical protein
MAYEYPILELPISVEKVEVDSGESGLIETEHMGSKEKFWVKSSATKQRVALFKFARENTGEDWSEKVASVVARKIGLPRAEVDLARYDGRRGVLAMDFVRDDESLVHGNEMLVEDDPAYPTQDKTYRTPQHTVAGVLGVLESHAVQVPHPSLVAGVSDAISVFIGYLLLDAIIGNQDRHHENWGVLMRRDANGARTIRLAPTYDHASSLGRELTDEARARRLTSQGLRGVPGYAEKGRSAFYLTATDAEPLSPLAALLEAGRARPAALRAWVEHCEMTGFDRLAQAVDPVPRALMSATAKDFALSLMRYNYQQVVSAVVS